MKAKELAWIRRLSVGVIQGIWVYINQRKLNVLLLTAFASKYGADSVVFIFPLLILMKRRDGCEAVFRYCKSVLKGRVYPVQGENDEKLRITVEALEGR